MNRDFQCVFPKLNGLVIMGRIWLQSQARYPQTGWGEHLGSELDVLIQDTDPAVGGRVGSSHVCPAKVRNKGNVHSQTGIAQWLLLCQWRGSLLRFSLAGCQVPTKAALSLPLLIWTGDRQYHARLMGQDEDREITHQLPLWAKQTQSGEISLIYHQLNQSRLMRNKTKS